MSAADVLPGPAGSPTAAVFNDQRLKLGLFSVNASGGVMMIKDSPHEVTWPAMVSIARKADAMGFELMVPVSRWRGFGGETNFNGTNFEGFTWAAGLAAVTRRMMVFATVHVPLIHPLVAAKMATTVDHISGGRFGMNLVMGWFTSEMGMFGIKQHDHDTRYRYGLEWVEIVDRLWRGDTPFDYDGEFFQLTGVEGSPRPVQPRPVLVNAGVSPAGTDFAARTVDFAFGSPTGVDGARELAATVREKARDGYGRDLGVFTLAMVFCRPTDAEAQAYYEQTVARGDWVCADETMASLRIDNTSFEGHIRDFQERFVIGFGAHNIVGTPHHVVAELQRLSDAGVDGVLLCFVDYDAELDVFAEHVMPLLVEAGLRHA